MLKYLFIILVLIIIFLLATNDLTNRQLKITERQNKEDILNLSGSNTRFRNLTSNAEIGHPARQNTCCNSHYELSDKYSLAKLNLICDMIPVEIQCMKKCLQISKDKRLEFNLEVSDRIEEWIEQKYSFQEVICAKIKKEINLHHKQLVSNVLPIEIAKLDNRLSKEEVFDLIKSISNNLGLNQLNTFENEFLSNDRQTNKFIVNRRGIEILKQVRMISRLLSEENKDRLKSRGLNPQIGESSKQSLGQSTNQQSKLNNNEINQINSNQFNRFEQHPIKPISQFHSSVYGPNRNQNLINHQPINYHQNAAYKPPPLNRKKNVDNDLEENETKSTSKEPNDEDDQRTNSTAGNYQCFQINLNQSVVDHLLKTYPNLTIVKLNEQNEQRVNQPHTRGLLSFLGFTSGKANDQKKQFSSDVERNDLATKLIQQFSSSPSHDSITRLASEALKNHSCDQEYLPNLSNLFSLNLRLKHLSNDYKQNSTDEINDLCNQILKIGGNLNSQLDDCKQSSGVDLMIKHTFNITEQSFKYCLNFEFKSRLMASTLVEDKQTSESNLVDQHLPSNELQQLDQPNQLNQLNKSEISETSQRISKLADCLDWHKLKSCQNRFIPWFELIEIEELKQLLDNKSMTFDELNLFKRNISALITSRQSDLIDSSNCVDVMLFENCVRQDLDDLFTVNLDETNGKLIDLSSDNTTCQFGIHKLNRIALINNLANKIINQINGQMSILCPKLSAILNLDKNSDQIEKANFKKNLVQHFSRKYIGESL